MLYKPTLKLHLVRRCLPQTKVSETSAIPVKVPVIPVFFFFLKKKIQTSVTYLERVTCDWCESSCNRDLLNGYYSTLSRVEPCFKNYSPTPNGLWVNSPRGRRPNGLLLRGHESERNNCFSKIQLVGQKYPDKTTLASKKRFSSHCFGFQSQHFSIIVGYYI